jgi:arylsulfatase A-like enzyme
MTAPLNVLLIVIDQLRADVLDGALAAHVPLPNLDRLRAAGTTFASHFTVTCPCGPSRASLLTGQYAFNHRSARNGTPLKAGLTNLALQARAAGREPLLFGYTDTTLDPRTRPPADPDLSSYEQVLPGFRQVLEMHQDTAWQWQAHLMARGYDLPPYPDLYVPQSPSGRPPRPSDPALYRAADSDTAYLTDEALKYLAVRAGSGWFAMLAYIRPHPPLVAPAPWNRLVDPAGLPPPRRLPARTDEAALHPVLAAGLDRIAIADTVRGVPGLSDTDPADVAEVRAVYLGLAAEVDHHLGRIWDALAARGDWDRTLIVVTSDHGDMLGDRWTWGKMAPFDAALRIPLVIRDPRRPASHGRAVTAFSESVDVAPTILDAIGAEVPPGMDGASLLPLLDGPAPQGWRDHAFAEIDLSEPVAPTIWQTRLGLPLRDANMAILREDRWKLVHVNGGLPPLLFDMATPDAELRDLASDPAHAGQVLRLTRKMLDHRMRHADRTLDRISRAP